MKMLKWFGIACLAFLLLLGALFLLLQTETVKKQLSTRLSTLLSTESDRKILVGDLEGWLPFHIRLAEFSVSDDGGVWLDIRDLVFEWSPGALLSGRIVIELLAAGKISLERLPPGEEGAVTETPAESKPLALPEAIPPISIEKIDIAELSLGRELAGQSAIFQIAGRLSPSSDQQGIKAVLEATRLDEGPQTRLDLHVTLDGQPKQLGLQGTFHEDSGGWLAGVVDLKEAGALDCSLGGNGPLASWLGTLSADVAAFGSLTSTLRLSVAEAVELALDGAYSANDAVIPARWEPLIGKVVRFGLDLAARPEREVVVRKASFGGKAGNVLIEGELDLQTSTLKADLEIALDNLKALTGENGLRPPEKAVPGTARVRARLAGDLQKRNASAEIVGNLKPSSDFPEKISSLLGAEVNLSTRVELHEGLRIAVPALTVAGSHFELSGRAAVDLENKHLRGDLQLTVPELKPLAPLVGKPLSGGALVALQAEGGFEAVKATLSVSGENLALDQLRLSKATMNLTGEDLPQTPRGELALALHKADAQLNLSAGYALQDRDLSLSSISFTAPGSEITGRVRFNFDSRLAAGTIDGNLKDLSLLGSFLERTMTGSGTVRAVLATEKGAQDINLQVSGRKLTLPGMTLAGASLTADLQNVYKLPKGTVDATLAGFQSSSVTVSRLSFKAKGDQQEIRFQGDAKGKIPTPFAFQLHGRGLLSETVRRLHLEAFKGKFGDYPIALAEPLALERTGTGFSLERLVLTFDKGRLAASGRVGPKGVQLEARFRELPLGAAALVGGPPLVGSVEGEIDVSGLRDRLQSNARVQIDDLRLPETPATDIPSLVLAARTVVSAGSLNLEATLAGLTEAPAQAALKIPVSYSPAPLSFSPITRGPCQGRLTVDADLAKLTKIVPLDAQSLSGTVSANLNLDGSLAAPQINGTITLQDGLYENYLTGTVLKNLNLDAVADEGRLRLAGFQAGDGGSGTIRAEGTVDLNPAAHFPLDVRLAFSEATLVRRSDVTGTITGNLALAGPANALKASGNLEVGPLEINLPERLPPDMTTVDVIEINKPGGTAASREESSGESPVKITLDIQSNLPGRIFVRGWGINSEWQGKLHLSGTGSRPQVSGYVSSVRGRVDFLNKRFDIVSGTIQFFGTTPPEPFIDLTAECQTKEITAKLTFSGPVKNPKLSLQSDPPLPRDEVLARLLFGRGAAEITPLQALRLATVAKSLTVGGGRELDFISRTRDFLGLDDLQFESAGQGFDKGSVGIGKYLTEGVYVDLEKGIGGDPDKASVEIEVTPHLSVESEIRSDKSTGIGVNYRIDY